jgi:hypothetical protein
VNPRDVESASLSLEAPMSQVRSGTVMQRGFVGFVALLFVVPCVGLALGDEVFLDGFEDGLVCWWSSTVGSVDPPCDVCFGQPDDTPCGETIYENCGPCSSFSSICDETGSQACDCTVFACSRGTCQESAAGCVRDCLRETDGNMCGMQVCGVAVFEDLCCANGICSEVCSDCGP